MVTLWRAVSARRFETAVEFDQDTWPGIILREQCAE
jgi:hypothetical protein